MNEDEFARKIAGHLHWGASHLEGAQLARLSASRERALAAAFSAARQPVGVLAPVTPSGKTLRLPRFSRKALFLLAIITVAGLWAYNQSIQDDFYDNVGELDAQLLGGELPIDAFLDKDFESWVKESSE